MGRDRYKLLFWTLIAVIFSFYIGINFAQSQGGIGGGSFVGLSMPSSIPNSGAWHGSEEVVCNNCLSINNIGTGAVGANELLDNSVTSTDILDGAILDGDVSTGAGIFSRKINGANGYHFNTPILTNTNTWYTLSTTGTTGMGSFDWSRIQITCEPLLSTPDNQITVKGGLGKDSIYRENSKMIYFSGVSTTQIFSVYLATNSGGGITHQQLDLRLNPTDSSKFQFRRSFAAGALSSSNEPQATQFECYFSILSLCSGGVNFGSSCG